MIVPDPPSPSSHASQVTFETRPNSTVTNSTIPGNLLVQEFCWVLLWWDFYCFFFLEKFSASPVVVVAPRSSNSMGFNSPSIGVKLDAHHSYIAMALIIAMIFVGRI